MMPTMMTHSAGLYGREQLAREQTISINLAGFCGHETDTINGDEIGFVTDESTPF